jgi:NADPH:quinone reductase-like Zn-dependent oxidoreductase
VAGSESGDDLGVDRPGGHVPERGLRWSARAWVDRYRACRVGVSRFRARLTASGGDASDLPPEVLQQLLDDVAAGSARVPVGHICRFDEIVQEHAAIQAGSAAGKLVVTV